MIVKRIEDLIAPLVANPKFIEIRTISETDKQIELLVMVEETDLKTVKGNHGSVIKAISNLSGFHQKKVKIKLEAF